MSAENQKRVTDLLSVLGFLALLGVGLLKEHWGKNDASEATPKDGQTALVQPSAWQDISGHT